VELRPFAVGDAANELTMSDIIDDLLKLVAERNPDFYEFMDGKLDDVTFFSHIRGGGLDLVQWNCQAPTNQTMSEATNVRRYTGSAGSAAS
jgi:hypothetical protein